MQKRSRPAICGLLLIGALAMSGLGQAKACSIPPGDSGSQLIFDINACWAASLGDTAIVGSAVGASYLVTPGAAKEYDLTLSQNLTLTLTPVSSPTNGVWDIAFKLCQGGSGGFGLTYSSSAALVFSALPGGGPPTLTTAAGSCDWHFWKYSQASNSWYLMRVLPNSVAAVAGTGACPSGTSATALQTAGPLCGTVGTVLKQNTQVGTPLATVTNTTTPTTVFSYTLAGGVLGNTGILRCDWWGDYSNTSGSASTFTVAATFGSRTITPYTASTATGVAGGWHVHADIINKTTQNQNTFWAQGEACNSAVSLPLTGSNCTDNIQNSNYSVAGVDTTVNETITLIVTESVASANITTDLWGGSCQLTTTN